MQEGCKRKVPTQLIFINMNLPVGFLNITVYSSGQLVNHKAVRLSLAHLSAMVVYHPVVLNTDTAERKGTFWPFSHCIDPCLDILTE